MAPSASRTLAPSRQAALPETRGAAGGSLGRREKVGAAGWGQEAAAVTRGAGLWTEPLETFSRPSLAGRVLPPPQLGRGLGSAPRPLAALRPRPRAQRRGEPQVCAPPPRWRRARRGGPWRVALVPQAPQSRPGGGARTDGRPGFCGNVRAGLPPDLTAYLEAGCPGPRVLLAGVL